MAMRHSLVGAAFLNGTIHRSKFCPKPLRVSNLSGWARMKNKCSKLYCRVVKDGDGVIASSEQPFKPLEAVSGAEKVNAVLFDMDGVLCNSEEASRQAGVDVFAEMGIKVTTEDFIPFMGTGEANFLGGVARVKNVKDFDPVAAKNRFFEIYLKKYARPNSGLGFPGSLELILQCKNEGLKVAVASSADRIKVNANLAAAGLHQSYFDAIVSADLFENLKPAPDIFLAAAKALNVPPNECVVVEDALAGVQAANAAKMRCIAVTTTLSEDKLLLAGPSLIRKDIGNISLSDILNCRRSDEKSQVGDQMENEKESSLEVSQGRTSAGHIPDIQSVLDAEILFPGG